MTTLSEQSDTLGLRAPRLGGSELTRVCSEPPRAEKTAQPVAPRLRAPWYLLVPAAMVLAGVALPVIYLLVRAFDAEPGMLREIVFRQRNLDLLGNTVSLTAAVLTVTLLLSVPTAWLTTRTDLPGRRWFSLLAVLPLAVPGYLMAYALLALGGPVGTGARLLGVTVPRPSGFLGSVICLGLYNVPYMFLNLRVAMQRLSPGLEESARSLGQSAWGVFFRVTLPQLRPAIAAGALLVGLHVIGDFGVVSLMRYPSFSFALYQQYETGGERIYAAWLALMLIALAAVLLIAEINFLRDLRLDPAGVVTPRARRPVALGWWKAPACVFLVTLALVSIVLPAVTILDWMRRATGPWWDGWLHAVRDSLIGSIPAAILTAALAVPLAYLGRRYPSPWTRGVERAAYIGYATPSLAFALGVIFFTLRLAPALYQTLGMLILVYMIHFLAEAVGPVRSALYTATPRLEEASRSLGHGQVQTFMRVTLPLLRGGIVAGAALVFLSVMKELPLTMILSPLGFETLAKNVWSYTNEAMFAQAAPYALTILVLSGGFVGLLLTREQEVST